MLEVLKTLTSLWHIIAFACGFLFVFQSYLALFGRVQYDPSHNRIIRYADRHLWLSGFAIIAVGLYINGPETYLSNPKLWTKVTLITIWAISTETMRAYALPRFRDGQRTPMIIAGTVSLACWIYGAFLGLAHGLAYGKAPLWALMSGYLVVLLGLSLLAFKLKSVPPLRLNNS